MTLDEFIASTIAQVMRGVSRAAQEHRADQIGGFICPVDAHKQSHFDGLNVTAINFDVAVTVESSHTNVKGGKAGIKVIEGSLTSERGEKHTGVSRVSFAVPVSLPGTRVES